MQTFKSIASVEALRHSPLYAILKQLVVLTTEDQPDYRPEDDGYFVLIEPGDVDRVLSDLDPPGELTSLGASFVGHLTHRNATVFFPREEAHRFLESHRTVCIRSTLESDVHAWTCGGILGREGSGEPGRISEFQRFTRPRPTPENQ